ncbi:hypothetical protein RS9916_28499 [Synechococcus sp. RS9916]|nr:hypothetical protein RS9916_28499 [Synechococcus sp. RS9916]
MPSSWVNDIATPPQGVRPDLPNRASY